MTHNTTTAGRISALESGLDSLESKIDALLGHFAPADAPKASTKAKRSAKGKGKATPTAEVRYLTRKNRAAFVKAHPWAQGLGTNAIAEAVVSGAQTTVKGWAIGNGRTERVTTGSFGTPSVGTKTAAKAAKSSAKKGSKKGAKRTRQVAKVDADAPAKVRPADGPRDAQGRITPRSEWALRESLAETGKFDRFEIDAAVKAQA